MAIASSGVIKQNTQCCGFKFHLNLGTLTLRERVGRWEIKTNATLAVCLTQRRSLEDSSAGKHVLTEQYIAFHNYSHTRPGLPQ